MLHVVAEAGSADMPVALRGSLLRPGEIAPRRFLRILAGEHSPLFTNGSGRRELAEAIASPENPLTARVMVNRVWMHHFGQALVRTPDNFGALGDKPTNPELLDWLARKFIAPATPVAQHSIEPPASAPAPSSSLNSQLSTSRWSLKKLHRTIMLSAAYQMSSRMDARSFQLDADNRLVWRMQPRRLDVEAWRDALLAVSGGLDPKLGGPPTDSVLSSPRRTIYATISRNGDKLASDDFLRLFDFPSARATNAGRNTSTIPQQYLFMMNNPFMSARAKALAARLQNDAADEPSRIARAYRFLFSRDPTPAERAPRPPFCKTPRSRKSRGSSTHRCF